MEKVARFEKISLKNFCQVMRDDFMLADIEAEAIYNNLLVPSRSTTGSAGYDFKMPFDLELSPGKSIRIPTGIRCRINPGWVMCIFPRSSLGFKYKLQLDNTVGIIDSDYYNADNEGHIMIKMTNNGDKDLSLKRGAGFAQGIFLPFGITEDDEVTQLRTGGFGSTDEKKTVIYKDSNPTTGYSWQAYVWNPEIVKVEGRYIPDEHPQGMVGAGGKHEFVFTGLKPGKTEVVLEYKRSWEEKADTRSVYLVKVSDDLSVSLL